MILYTNYLLRQVCKQAISQKEKLAIKTASGKAISWSELSNKVDSLAVNLIKNGFQRKDRVLFLVKPSIEAIIVLLGVVRAGGVLVTADPAMGEENFKSRVNISEPKWVFCESLILGLQRFGFIRKALRERNIELPETGSLFKNIKIIRTGFWLPVKAGFHLKNLLNHNSQKNDFIEEELSGDIQVTFTSGTTSAPSGVVHTSESFDSMVRLVKNSLQSSHQDVFFTNQYYIILPALASGSSVVLNDSLTFESKKYYKNLMKFQITHLFDIPKNLQSLIKYCNQKKLKLPKQVSTIITGSTPVLKSFLSNLQEIVEPQTIIWSVYGMTEILPISLVQAKEKIAYNGKGDLLGKPFDGIDINFADDEELLVRGPNMCDRYLGKKRLNQVNTGDICKLDKIGRLILMSRKKDMIIKSHFNIYPTLFETTISQIPGIEQCSMLGIFDHDKQDEKVILIIVRNNLNTQSDSAFLETVQNQLKTGKYSIDKYAYPDKFLIIKSLPTFGRSQKVDKNQLKKIVLANEY
ncbi:MAG: class I adenylate-forming enzyme family protein [Patescibacteria group bacterium]